MQQHVRLHRSAAEGSLSELVRWFWAVDFDIPGDEVFVQPVLSHPGANLSIGPSRTRLAVPDRIEATVVGVVTTLDERHLSGTGWNVAATLRPGALGAFLPGSAAELTDHIVPMRELLDLDAATLERDAIAAAPDVTAQFAVLADSLRGLIERAAERRVAVACEMARIGTLAETDRSIRSAAELATIAGVSLRTLQRQFREYAGVSPLWVIRRYRLIEAADAARAGRLPSWADLAAELGYSDQAHLVRDFTATLGIPPARYAASVTPL